MYCKRDPLQPFTFFFLFFYCSPFELHPNEWKVTNCSTQFNFVFMINPVALFKLHSIFLLWFLVHYSANLSTFLLFFIKIHRLNIFVNGDFRVFGSNSNYNLFGLTLSVSSSYLHFFFNLLLVTEHTSVLAGYEEMVLSHHIRIVIIKQSKTIFAPSFSLNLEANKKILFVNTKNLLGLIHFERKFSIFMLVIILLKIWFEFVHMCSNKFLMLVINFYYFPCFL